MNHVMQRDGLTLLELMVVLIILAIVATVAMRSLEPQINSQRIQSASQLLEQIRDATLGEPNKYQLDGTPLTSGFVADVGCLPVAPVDQRLDNRNNFEFVLAELWDPESSLATSFPFQFRPGPQSPVDYSAVRIPCGWRGPYMRLSPGANGLVDPWGQKPLLIPDGEGQVGMVKIEVPESAELPNPERMSIDLSGGKVDVTATILLDDADQSNVVGALLAPDPETSLTTLAAIADEDSDRATMLFRNVPIGFRAIVVDVGQQRQVKYLQVSQLGANLVFDFRSPRPQ
ncbi:MAG: prepilin-type N-terminal cleavage/methylation domain-containing protein [Planctomycetota bacterium]